MKIPLAVTAALVLVCAHGVGWGAPTPPEKNAAVSGQLAGGQQPSLRQRYIVAQLDRNADDANPGTEEKPFKSITGCLAKVKGQLGPGDTIFVKNGTYRETISLIGAKKAYPGVQIRSGKSYSEMIRIQAYPGGKPVIKGSDVVTGWSRHTGDIWVKDGWDFNSQQVFADGELLDQVGGVMGSATGALMTSWHPKNKGKALEDMYAGSFYYDKTGKKLYVWLKDSKAPKDALVEADARTFLVYVGDLEYIGIAGFTLRHGSNRLYEAAIAVNGRFCMIDNIDQAWHAFGGAFVGGDYLTFSHCRFNHNGNNGMGGRRRGNRILYCETMHNNYRNFSSGWHAGGTKFIPYCHDWIVKGHVSAYNNGDGIWFDGWMSNVTIEECISYRNRGSGIHYEIGSRAVIKNNILYENGMRGIYLSNASHSLVANNLCYRNGLSGIASIAAARKDNDIYTRGESGHVPGGNNVVSGNILVDNCWTKQLVEDVPTWGLSEQVEGSYLWLMKQFVTWGSRPELLMPEQEGGNEGCYSDYNVFYRTGERGAPERLAFGRNWNVGYAYGLKDWRAKTGWDKNSIFAKPEFVDEAGRDFHPADNCPSLWFVKKVSQSVCYSIEDVLRPGWCAPVTAGPYGGDPELFTTMSKRMSVDRNLICKLPNFGSVNRQKLTKIPYTLITELEKHYLTPVRQGIRLDDVPFLAETHAVIYLTEKNMSKAITLDWTAKKLYILFAAEGCTDQPFAKITVHRDDGVNVDIEVRSDGKEGFTARDLRNDDASPVARVWQGKVQYYSDKTRIEPASVFMLTWTNDNPWAPTKKLEFRLLDPEALVAIVGLSGESNIE
ncbi:MAG: hypothetical protein HN742_19530 [Lentisphaerae bacterium]|nr:hypothetical protein [Lentisphaerota bacterium]MBT5609961.1 hypothetical protein [Lentisphaerota bacterium]MBT7054496.1 hypothetical protein [Lentisphaerota bacterium]MBT7844081.1 hypothetical protein [Lentisphaerota bacterium]